MSEVLLAVQNSVYGANHNEPGIGKKSASTPKKRPAPEDDPALKDALAQHDYKVLPLMQRSIAATCPSLFQNALTCAPHTSGSENDTASKPQDLSRQPALLHVSFALSGSQSSSLLYSLNRPPNLPARPHQHSQSLMSMTSAFLHCRRWQLQES